MLKADILIIDEPFSNSDEKLWRNIYEAINLKERSIILSHLPLENFFDFNKNDISIDVNQIKMEFN